MAHANIKSLPLSLVLVGSVLLTACSSKPSPWEESASPWDNRQQVESEPEMVEAMAEEEVEAEASEFVDMDAVEASPVSGEPMYAEPMALEAEPMSVEVVAVEPESMMMEPVAPVAMTGNLSVQPAEYYVVQVVASSTMAQLNEFANANSMSSEWIAETNVNGKTWYVLMLGVYPSKFEADQALASVSSMDTQPWVRSVGSLQSVMK